MQKGMELGEISSVHRNAQNEKQKLLGSFISYVLCRVEIINNTRIRGGPELRTVP